MSNPGPPRTQVWEAVAPPPDAILEDDCIVIPAEGDCNANMAGGTLMATSIWFHFHNNNLIHENSRWQTRSQDSDGKIIKTSDAAAEVTQGCHPYCRCGLGTGIQKYVLINTSEHIDTRSSYIHFLCPSIKRRRDPCAATSGGEITIILDHREAEVILSDRLNSGK